MTKPIQSITQELKDKAVDALKGSDEPIQKYTYSYAELHAEKDIVQNFLIDDLIPDEEICAMIGVDGIGKTQICSQLCFAIGTKRTNFLGLNLNVKHGNALIVATEDSRKKFTRAITKIGYGLDPKHDPKVVGVHFTEGGDFADLPSFIKEIVDHLKKFPCDLVVIDALQDLFLLIDGEVNSNSHANKILNTIQIEICNKYKCAVMLIHHASKSSARAKQEKGKFFLVKDDSQGAGRITQKPRTVLGLTHDFASSAIEDSTTYLNYLHVLKTNLASRRYMQNAISLTFDQSTLLHESNGLVNIEQYENSDKTANDFTPTKKPMAKEITIDQHKDKLTAAFGEKETLSRKELVAQLRSLYGVGANKIEEKGGYLSYLTDFGLIVGDVGIFRKGSTSDFKMPISSENWDVVQTPIENGVFITIDKPKNDIIIKPNHLLDGGSNESDIPF